MIYQGFKNLIIVFLDRMGKSRFKYFREELVMMNINNLLLKQKWIQFKHIN